MPHASVTVCLPGTTSASLAVGLAAIARSERHDRELSAIDRALDSLVALTQLVAMAQPVWSSQYGLALSASAVAVADDYFRSMFVEVIDVCPLAAQRTGSLETRLEYVSKGSRAEAMRDILSLSSFASMSTVSGWLKQVVGVKALPIDLKRVLQDYETVCQVRHVAIHTGGHVTNLNAEKLGVPVGAWLYPDSSKAVYEIIAVVAAAVRAFNQATLDAVIGGWLDAGLLSGEWENDRPLFAPLWRSFYSERDRASAVASNNGGIRSNVYQAYRVVQASARSRYVGNV